MLRLVSIISWILLFSLNAQARIIHAQTSLPRGFENALENRLKQLMPESWSELKDIKVSFVAFKRKNQQGVYSKLTKQIKISENLLKNQKVLLRTIIHELSHAYEDQIGPVSNNDQFQHLAGWHKRGLMILTRRHNFDDERSPDRYEFKNPAESFAVNMEYFLTDENYKCRRPSLYNYLSKKFNHTPYPEVNCQSTNLFPIFRMGELSFQELDQNRLYEVHYLMAAKGEGIASRFGHSMIRLVFCAPERKVKSKECLNDLDHHIVLSYRANPQNLVISNIKGLLGKYPSQVYLYSMLSIMKEYNQTESRDLYSYPIALTKYQKSQVFSRLKEVVWNYVGKYRFITQNCATETADFIKTLAPEMNLHNIRALSPKSVFVKFNKAGLIKDIPKDKKIENKYLFLSKKPRYAKYLSQITPIIGKSSIDEYVEMTAQERQRFIDQVANHPKKLSLLATMHILETYVFSLKTEHFQKEAATKFLKLKSNSALMDKINIFLKKRFEGKVKINSQGHSYGIPLANEVALPKTDETDANLKTLTSKIDDWARSEFSEEIAELNSIKLNIEQLEKIFSSDEVTESLLPLASLPAW